MVAVVRIRVSDALCGRLAFPLQSVVGQRLILNLREYQPRSFTSRDLSREVDRQIAAMGDLLWPDLGTDEEQPNEEQIESGKTNDTSMATDLELEVIEVRPRRDQGLPRSHSPHS